MENRVIMESRVITSELIDMYCGMLKLWERSIHTIERYLTDLRAYAAFLDGREACAELTCAFKKNLIRRGYAASSINTILASLFTFFSYMGWKDCGTQRENIQDDSYISENAELSRGEYGSLLDAAKCDRDRLVMETLCSTGIRVSELDFFTLEGVRERQVVVKCKRKIRRIMIPSDLGWALEAFAEAKGITSGVIFIGRNGKPLDRRRIWKIMKDAGKRAGVISEKVYPHSLRKLFARTFIEAGGSLTQLCDVLGHSSIETTRLYIKTSGAAHRELVDRMGLATPPRSSDKGEENIAHKERNCKRQRTDKNQRTEDNQGSAENRRLVKRRKLSKKQRRIEQQRLSEKSAATENTHIHEASSKTVKTKNPFQHQKKRRGKGKRAKK